MKSKNSRLDAIKIIISSKEVGSQEELLQELAKEGFRLTQATLSRDLMYMGNGPCQVFLLHTAIADYNDFVQ